MNIGTLTIEMAANVARLRRDMEQTKATVQGAATSVQKSADQASRALANMGGALRGVIAGLSIQQVVQVSDQYAKFTAQLRLATTSTESFVRASSDVKRIAEATQGGLSGVATLYARITQATRELGISQTQVSKITETVGLSLRVSGATAQESSSAMLQLSQAFASGALRGEEFNAVNEAAPGLLRILAESMGVSIGQLKGLASEGKITTEVLARAFTNDAALAGLRNQAKGINTISGAVQLLKDQFTLFVGGQAEASGAAKAIAGALGALAKNLDVVVVAALSFAAVKLANILNGVVTSALASVSAYQAKAAATLVAARADATAAAQAEFLAATRVAELRAAVLAAEGNTALAITTNGLIPAQARATAAAATHTAALTTLSAAQRAASTTSTALSAAMRFLGGPIGLITTVLGLAATAWTLWGNSSKSANDQAQSSTEASTRDILQNLEAQNGKLRERIALASAGNAEIAKSGGEGASNLASILQKINVLKAKGNELTSLERLDLVTLQGYYDDLSDKLKTNASLQGQINGLSDQAKAKDWLAKYATDAEKLAAELEKAKKELGTAFTPEIEKRIRASFNKSTVKDFNQSLADQAKLLAELNGLNPDYLKDLNDLQALLKRGSITQAQYVEFVEKLIASQPSSIKLAKEQADAIKQVADAEADGLKVYQDMIDALNKGVQTQRDRVTALEAEAEAERLAESLNISLAQAVELVNIAKLEEKRIGATDPAVIRALEDEIAARQRILELTANGEARKANSDAAKAAADEWRRFTQDLERGLTDSLFRAFESGKGFFKTLWDGIRNLFKTTVLKAIIQPVVGGITGTLGLTGAANAATGGGSLSGITSLFGGSSSFTTDGIISGLSRLSNAFPDLTSATNSLSRIVASNSQVINGLGNTLAGFAIGSGLNGAISGGFRVSGTTDTVQQIGIAVASYLGGPLGGAISGAISGVFNRAFGRKLADSGVQGTFGNAGFEGNSFQFLKGGLFRSDKTVLGELDATIKKQLGDTFKAMQVQTALFAEALGVNASSVADFTAAIKISTKGLTDDQIAQAFQAELLRVSDQLVAATVDLTGFEREGETLTQTLGRLAGSLQTVNSTFDLLGLTLADASLAGADAASKFVELFGGVEQFGQVTSSYYANFYTEAERTATTVEALRGQFVALNNSGAFAGTADAFQQFVIDPTRDSFRQLVEAQDVNTEAGRNTIAALLGLSDTFASVVPAIDAAKEAASRQAEQDRLQAAAINSERSDRLRIERETAAAAKAASEELAKLNEQNFRLAISAGNVNAALAARGNTGPRFADFQGSNGFNVAGYNAALLQDQQRSLQQILDELRRQNPFEVSDYFGAINELETTIANFSASLASGEFTGGVSDLEAQAQAAFGDFLSPEQIQAAADGLTAFSNVLSLVNGAAAQGALGADAALRVLQGAYAGSAQQTEEYARALDIIGQSVGVSTGNLQEIQAAINSGLAYFNSNEYAQSIAQEQLRQQIDFTNRAFSALTERAAAFNGQAEDVENSIASIEGFIGRLTSVADAFDNAAGERAVDATLISDAARRFADLVTVPVAQAAQSILSSLPSFENVEAPVLRDITLLLKDLEQFDNEGLEATFIRISDAFASGSVRGEQYADLLDYIEQVYLGTAESITTATDNIANAAQQRLDLEERLAIAIGGQEEVLRRQAAAIDESNLALYNQVLAAEEYRTLVDQRTALEQELFEATATQAEILARQREALDESNRSTFDQVQALQQQIDALRLAEEAERDLAAQRERVSQEREGLERQLLEAQGNSAALLALQRDALDESNRALFDQIQALTAQQAAAAAAERAVQELAAAQERVANERLGLEQQLLQLQGNTVEIRRREREALDESNRALYDQIQALQDQQAINSERLSLEQRLLQAQGNTEALRALELAALDESNRAILLQIFALEDAAAAAAAAESATNGNNDAQNALAEAMRLQEAIANERIGLERQLLEAMGDTAAIAALDRAAINSANLALYDQVVAARAASQAAQELADTQQRIASEREGLESRLLQLQGDTAALRAAEIAALDASNRALLEQIFALEDAATAAQAAAAIADERLGLERQLLQAQGDTVALRNLERGALDESNRALFDQIRAVEDAQAAQDAYNQVIERTKSAVSTIAGQIDAFQTRADQAAAQLLSVQQRIQSQYVAAQNRVADAQQRIADLNNEAAKSLRGVGGSIKDFLTGLNVTGSGGLLAQSSVLESQFAIATAQARAGDQAAAGRVTGIAQQLLANFETTSTNRLDLLRNQGLITNQLADLADVLSATPVADPLSEIAQANNELLAAQEELARLAVLSAQTGSSTAAAAENLLAEFMAARDAQALADSELQQALSATQGINLAQLSELEQLNQNVAEYLAAQAVANGFTFTPEGQAPIITTPVAVQPAAPVVQSNTELVAELRRVNEKLAAVEGRLARITTATEKSADVLDRSDNGNALRTVAA